MSTKTWNGWYTGAVVTAVLAVYTGFLSNHPGPPGARYSCGAVWNSTFPKDGNGPCTEILNDAANVPIGLIILTVILAVIGSPVSTKL
jgi:CDP-diglyceride synthetase